MPKKLSGLYSPAARHWTANGLPSRTLFDVHSHGASISPFLRLEHTDPTPLTARPAHHSTRAQSHHGMEMVTIVYEGELSHRDSTGAGGTMGPNQVQWMTAGCGVMLEPYHTSSLERQGGRLEVVQLWVDLPAAQKMAAPRFQHLTQAHIPEVALAQNAGVVRVIAGNYQGHTGAAATYTPLNVWDVRLRSSAQTPLLWPAGHSLMVLVLQGVLHIQGQLAHNGQWLHLSREGTQLQLKASTDAKLLLFGGETFAQTAPHSDRSVPMPPVPL